VLLPLPPARPRCRQVPPPCPPTDSRASQTPLPPFTPQEKWSATLWIHVAKYRGLDEPVKRPPCGDENDMCAGERGAGGSLGARGEARGRGGVGAPGLWKAELAPGRSRLCLPPPPAPFSRLPRRVGLLWRCARGRRGLLLRRRRSARPRRRGGGAGRERPAALLSCPPLTPVAPLNARRQPPTPECDKNPAYMLESCKAACKLCNPDGTHKDPSKAPAPLKQGEQ
jgi:hypothetical protein